jgi:hypothetical protein
MRHPLTYPVSCTLQIIGINEQNVGREDLPLEQRDVKGVPKTSTLLRRVRRPRVRSAADARNIQNSASMQASLCGRIEKILVRAPGSKLCTVAGLTHP